MVTRKGHRPMTVMAINVVVTERLFIMPRPKLLARLLSIPGGERHIRQGKQQSNEVVTLEIFSESVKKTATRNRIVKPNISE
jgi:hypothetical protein